MEGFDDDDKGPERFRPPPHPDDRLWRHPSEVAAILAAQAETAPTPPAAPSPIPDQIPDQRAAPRIGRRRRRGLALAGVVVAVGAVALSVGALSVRRGTMTVQVTLAQPVSLNLETDSPVNSAALNTNSGPAAISVETAAEAALAGRLHSELARSLPRVEAATATGMREGSGIFVTSSGHVVTSAGLIEGADYVLVWTDDGRRLRAEILAVDPFSDVAVLTVGDDSIGPARLRDETHLWSGQYALTIDHNARTLAIGSVESMGAADIAAEFGDLATRVIIDDGATPGAAIIDDSGHVIAMVNHAQGPSRQATPAWIVQRVASELIAVGATSHTWLGVAADSLPDGNQARVTHVVPGSPADDAGLRVDDIIDAIDGDSLSAASPLWTLLQSRHPGDRVALAVTRNGERRLIGALLSARPD